MDSEAQILTPVISLKNTTVSLPRPEMADKLEQHIIFNCTTYRTKIDFRFSAPLNDVFTLVLFEAALCVCMGSITLKIMSDLFHNTGVRPVRAAPAIYLQLISIVLLPCMNCTQ